MNLSTPTYSILISSRNEGQALRRTVDDLLHHSPQGTFEVIVVDDASGDGSADFLQSSQYSGSPLRILRNETPRGLIFSRALAADQARGAYLCVLDAHCCVTEDWLERLAERSSSIDDRGIVVPAIYRLDPRNWTLNLEAGPATGSTIVNSLLEFHWVEPRIVDGFPSTATIGGGAWMCSRRWYDHIGGLDRGMLEWGGENIDIPLRTWILGGRCLVAADVHIGHFFKSKPAIHTTRSSAADGSMGPGVSLAFNKIRAAHNVFSKETMQRVIKNLSYLPGFKEALDLIRRDAEDIARFKTHVESRRKRSDHWLIETFELPVFEAPLFFDRSRRAKDRPYVRPRPPVSVIVRSAGEAKNLEGLLSTLFEKTSYQKYEVIVAASAPEDGALDFLRRDPYRENSRLRVAQISTPLGAAPSGNMGALFSDAEFLVFLDEDAEILDDHWLEKFILLFEKRPRLLLASPRIQRPSAGDENAEKRDEFDVSWDWDAPCFSRPRVGSPLGFEPYQALSCPGTCLVVHRERFVELGGFDRTAREGAAPILDLAIHGWLAGYEVFCHPGVSVGRRQRLEPEETETPSSALQWRDYGQVLPAVKYFTNTTRIELCRSRSPRADALIQKHEFYLQRCRRKFLDYARFDDDWLFYKFDIEDTTNDGEL